MLKTNLPAAAVTAMLGAFSFGIVAPTANAVPAIGNPSTIAVAADPTIKAAYVKKKIVVKKKGYKKTTRIYSRTRHRTGYGYALGYYHPPRAYSCGKYVRTVRYVHHRRVVKVVRRGC